MNYISTEKTATYHAKSFAMTFVSVFVAILAVQITTLDFSSIDPRSITLETIGSGLVAFVRVALVVGLQALQQTLKK